MKTWTNPDTGQTVPVLSTGERIVLAKAKDLFEQAAWHARGQAAIVERLTTASSAVDDLLAQDDEQAEESENPQAA